MQGDRRVAHQLFEGIAREDFAALPVETSTMVTFAFCAELCTHFGDARRAGQLYRPAAGAVPRQVAVWAVAGRTIRPLSVWPDR